MFFLGWKTLYIDLDGLPTMQKTEWRASCFVLFFWVVWIGDVVAC